MKTLKEVLAYISSCKIWLIALACANVLLSFCMVCISGRILQPYMVNGFRFRWDILYPTVYFSETAPQDANRISPFSYGA